MPVRKGKKSRMTTQTRALSYLVLLLAVVLPSIVLFTSGDKGLARILFAVVIVVGYGIVILRVRRGQ